MSGLFIDNNLYLDLDHHYSRQSTGQNASQSRTVSSSNISVNNVVKRSVNPPVQKPVGISKPTVGQISIPQKPAVAAVNSTFTVQNNSVPKVVSPNVNAFIFTAAND